MGRGWGTDQVACKLPAYSKLPLIGQQGVPGPVGGKDVSPHFCLSPTLYDFTPLPPSLHIPPLLSPPLISFSFPFSFPLSYHPSRILLPASSPPSFSFSTHRFWFSLPSHSAFSLFLRSLSVHLFDLIYVSILAQFPLFLLSFHSLPAWPTELYT